MTHLLGIGPRRDYLHGKEIETAAMEELSQDEIYLQAAQEYGPALERLAAAYEADPDRRRDLGQDIHFQLWRSLQRFDGRCSLRTWVYRVAHNVAASHVMRERRRFFGLVSLEEIEALPTVDSGPSAAEHRINLNRLMALIQRLKPLDRQIMVSYLEDLDAACIGEITGLSAANVAMRIHRVKKLLAEQFRQGGNHAG
ncbi:MAG TPA: sigma-70 family RNA polymerase sigma factor [Terracidiphilus sp.]|nr:sigma-70 family RNA polymerase sigma factor [Terracidiphilus sp.]